ncbi:hypothetical protein A3F00_02000 [Candidatus Daviesbacteria bacterium RIFCSPHIGHO2_12_FULL_37_11]|uniref:ATP synthase F1 complex delta/epsilon subunit N-terminal domain-containing protein n=1 Tax=Candidatus Daviesbacteria bacterium RIFCSPHIGHO2_12_FULL_37_11 TaxID=1797777 RepID=A0A1F5KEC7_9BACT|nr:MAG: hypothetical protein A2111_00670 [Candidatus Daviesbacteria bacterium GWA1_38_6]OGE17663.1 MAG: hypothetical protein A2769_04095 [Candidatus Daviesbacteria bacterium RIFCSPHIGHO2_01_FULL_37_27]OGE38961.1 MAG: hypothetical protein A3F00_02000 [Candidatus Daviesbacteria bacterium RIFCSPHIGHO2_12_FULL_37_11]OGE46174.1 MAG: hypothetical protein A3B39_02140 [Candidatus Daviesbacteria bacterium RIFCSPLOWO2_01_FULL_37_10]
MAEETLKLRIVTPRAVVFEGKALSISSTNSKGKFDILPKHANFITIVEQKPIIIRVEGRKRLTFNFPVAIISNVRNQVNIYTDISLK